MVTKQFRLSSSKNCAELQKCVGMAERDEADATILLSRPETGYRVPINADARVTPYPSWTLAIFQRRRKLLLTSSRVAACNAPRRHRGRARVNRQLNFTGSELKVMAAGIHPGLARAELPGPLVRERRMSDATARKVPSSLAVWMQPFRDVVTAPPDNTCGCSWRERSSFPACELSPPRCASWSAPRFRARPTTAACRTATNGPPADSSVVCSACASIPSSQATSRSWSASTTPSSGDGGPASRSATSTAVRCASPAATSSRRAAGAGWR